MSVFNSEFIKNVNKYIHSGQIIKAFIINKCLHLQRTSGESIYCIIKDAIGIL